VGESRCDAEAEEVEEAKEVQEEGSREKRRERLALRADFLSGLKAPTP